jgi:hypothetical protein
MTRFEVFFVFKGNKYLTRNYTWSTNIADVCLMSEKEANDLLITIDGGCGSMIVTKE